MDSTACRCAHAPFFTPVTVCVLAWVGPGLTDDTCSTLLQRMLLTPSSQRRLARGPRGMLYMVGKYLSMYI